MDAGVRQADDTAEQTASEPASASYGVWQRTRADFTRMRRARVHWRTPGMLSVVLYTILAQALIAVLIGPLLQFLFSTALETAGLDGFELPRVGALLGSPAPVALLIALVVIALATVSLQLCLIVFVVDLVRHGQRPTPRRVWQLLRCIPGVISHGAAGGLFGYVFVILPLAGFGAFSMLTRAISIPPFITGELEKTTAGSVALIVLFVVIWYANIRFALTIPLLVSAASKRLDLVSSADTVAGGAVGSGVLRSLHGSIP